MKFALLLFALSACLFALGGTGFAVVGYAPEYRYGGIDFAAVSPHLTHLILFSLEVAPDGSLTALDRLPSKDILQQARQSSLASGTKLLICLGGNSRSGAFPKVVLSTKLRTSLVGHLNKLLDETNLDGVDLNWEYPQNRAQWQGLFDLEEELHKSFQEKRRVLTMAFYPGQEEVFTKQAIDSVDLFLAMAYDARGQHSTMRFAKDIIKSLKSNFKQGKTALPLDKVAIGLPFYGRDVNSGEPKTYSEIVRDLNPQTDDIDQIQTMYWNSPKTISEKTLLAKRKGLGGVMIWEIGQDVHPSNPRSLLLAISKSLEKTQEPQTNKQEL